jgi:hypothetical protein
MCDFSWELTVMPLINWRLQKLRERLLVSKQGAQNFDVERFSFKQLGELDVRKKYQIKISDRLPALENLNDSEDINRALGKH